MHAPKVAPDGEPQGTDAARNRPSPGEQRVEDSKTIKKNRLAGNRRRVEQSTGHPSPVPVACRWNILGKKIPHHHHRLRLLEPPCVINNSSCIASGKTLAYVTAHPCPPPRSPGFFFH
ncbi:hypothetical protein AVEN_203497-1 [Araneus ventricosus]|uniref:Uncharacterized protein n=1 Tax=Araneus ventricosus TaxID=182803 RepID=A0A4Y2BHZ4_ARAVE|nr:hypothetical protein AVEN_203497-1 [Araneus ventricosus]